MGGLVLFWKASVNLLVEDSHRYFIDASINKNTEAEWRFTGFYGEPDTSKRQDAWQQLRILNNCPNISWLCAVDFNEITKQGEKVGGALRSHVQCNSSKM